MKIDETEKLKSILNHQKVYVFCRSGYNSVLATNFLQERGIDACNVIGGLREYVKYKNLDKVII